MKPVKHTNRTVRIPSAELRRLELRVREEDLKSANAVIVALIKRFNRKRVKCGLEDW